MCRSEFDPGSEMVSADEQRRRAAAKLEALLLEGLDSGEPIEITPGFWERKRISLLAKHGIAENG